MCFVKIRFVEERKGKELLLRREDPMPTVVAEAMFYGVPCIVSDAVGTAEYITEKGMV